jgi:hypothetical protein
MGAPTETRFDSDSLPQGKYWERQISKLGCAMFTLSSRGNKKLFPEKFLRSFFQKATALVLPDKSEFMSHGDCGKALEK